MSGMAAACSVTAVVIVAVTLFIFLDHKRFLRQCKQAREDWFNPDWHRTPEETSQWLRHFRLAAEIQRNERSGWYLYLAGAIIAIAIVLALFGRLV